MNQNDKAKEAVDLVNRAEKLARDAMQPHVNVWNEAIDAFQQKGPVSNPNRVNLKAGRLIADSEAVVSRDAISLLGERPFMPVQAKRADQAHRANAQEKVCDHFTNLADSFFRAFSDALRMARVFGIAYIEPRWAFWPYTIFQRNVEKDRFGRIVRINEFRENTVKEGMEWVVLDPWTVRPHPFGNSLFRKPETTDVQLASVYEIERLIENPHHPYKLQSGVNASDLRKSASEEHGEWAIQLRRERQSISKEIGDKIGVLMRFYQDPSPEHPGGRWIHTWNRTILLMDTENQHGNMPLQCKPYAALRNISHIGPDRYWPIGMYEFTKDLAHWGDRFVSMYFDAVIQNSAQWMLFNPELVHREDLVATPGQRIPVQNGRFDEAIQQLKVGQPPSELMDLYEIVDQFHDTRLGLSPYQQAGEEPRRKETATATQALKAPGDLRLEYNVLHMEQTGLADTAYLTYKQIDHHILDGEKNNIIGFDLAQEMRSVDPDTLDGGYTWGFAGSASVRRQTVKTEKFVEFYNMVRNQPTVLNPVVLDRKLGQMTEAMSDEELDQAGLSLEAQQAMQEQQMMQGMPPEQGAAPPVSRGGAMMPPDQIPTPAMNLETEMPA